MRVRRLPELFHFEEVRASDCLCFTLSSAGRVLREHLEQRLGRGAVLSEVAARRCAAP